METEEQLEKIVNELEFHPRKCENPGCPNETVTPKARYCSKSCASKHSWATQKGSFKDRSCSLCERAFKPNGSNQRYCRREDCRDVAAKLLSSSKRKAIRITEKDRVSADEGIIQAASLNRSEEIVFQETEKLCVAADEAFSAIGRALSSAFRIEAFGIAHGRKTITVEHVRSMLQAGLEARGASDVPQGVLLGEVPTRSEHYKDEVRKPARPGKRSHSEAVRSDG